MRTNMDKGSCATKQQAELSPVAAFTLRKKNYKYQNIYFIRRHPCNNYSGFIQLNKSNCSIVRST